jgi:hypothetical protein
LIFPLHFLTLPLYFLIFPLHFLTLVYIFVSMGKLCEMLNIVSKKFIEKPSRIQNFKILEPLFDFKFNFKVSKFIAKNFQKALFPYKFSWERVFWKFLAMNLLTLKLNIKSNSGSKILESTKKVSKHLLKKWRRLVLFFKEGISRKCLTVGF